MTNICTTVMIAFAGMALFLGTSAALAQTPDASAWRDSEIGAPKTPGNHKFADGVLTITGSGGGFADGKADRLHLVWVTQAEGDFELVARVARFDGTAQNAAAGLMIRASNEPQAAMSAVFLTTKKPEGKGTSAISWSMRHYDPGAKQPSMEGGGVESSLKPPCWLKLIRVGTNFAVYKSPDGKLWSAISNTSGGACQIKGQLRVGLFVASGNDSPITASFDSIKIGPPDMGYKTSWVGNNFGANRDDGFVSNGVSAMWVAPDGTAFTNSYWDEGGEPVKSYRDGRVIKAFRDGNEAFGNSFCGEGSITGDAKHIYVASRQNIYETDYSGSPSATRPLLLLVDPFDGKKQVNIMGGMASSGRELFLSDTRDNLIRVVSLTNLPQYYQAGNTSVNFSPKPIDTTGVTNAAPAEVYMTARENDYNPYVFPNLKPDATYTVRAHFAEYTEKEPGTRMVSWSAGGTEAQIVDVVKEAGGPFKALVKELKGAKAGKDGRLGVTFSRVTGVKNGHLIICGIEIFDAAGKRVVALNCGGGAVKGFQGEAAEIGSRAFRFDRPGPMTIDQRGNLWIIQRADDFPTSGLPQTKYPGAVKCYKPDGTFTNIQITDVTNPSALAYVPATDELLVAESGPDLNIRRYGSLNTSPKLQGVFGAKGGIYAGAHPGLLSDPAAGNSARFGFISGVGLDRDGNYYVASSLQGTDLRKLKPDGSLVWMVNGLLFCNTVGVDPASDGADIYSTYHHMGLDLTKSAPGSEWTYKAYNWDIRNYGAPVRGSASQALLRRLGPKKDLILFTSGQGNIESAKIFRYQGELAIPAGEIRPNSIWIDTNGDGKETTDEVSPLSTQIAWFSVADTGDIFFCGGIDVVGRQLRFKGMTDKGVPLYGVTKDKDYVDFMFPGIGKPVSAWATPTKIHYDSAGDLMVLVGPSAPRQGDGDVPHNYLAVYENWSKGNRKAKWLINLPSPLENPNFMYELSQPYNLPMHYMGMQLTGDYIFIATLWGEVHVYSLTDGSLVKILTPGPENAGRGAWEDAAMGLTAFKRANGEYLVFTENSGWGGKNPMYRWRP